MPVSRPRLLTMLALAAAAVLAAAPTCSGEDPRVDEGRKEAEAPPESPGSPSIPEPALAEPAPEDPCAVCVLGRELTPEEQAICVRCNQPPTELAPAVPSDPCSVCIEGRALSPDEQELCARCNAG